MIISKEKARFKLIVTANHVGKANLEP